jgi:hypothetical protein
MWCHVRDQVPDQFRGQDGCSATHVWERLCVRSCVGACGRAGGRAHYRRGNEASQHWCRCLGSSEPRPHDQHSSSRDSQQEATPRRNDVPRGSRPAVSNFRLTLRRRCDAVMHNPRLHNVFTSHTWTCIAVYGMLYPSRPPLSLSQGASGLSPRPRSFSRWARCCRRRSAPWTSTTSSWTPRPASRPTSRCWSTLGRTPPRASCCCSVRRCAVPEEVEGGLINETAARRRQ